MSGNRVHRCTAFDRTDRKGGLRIFRNLDVGNDIAGAANRMDGARNLAEVGKGVSARTVHGQTPAVRADGAVKDAADIGTVDRDKAVELVVGAEVLGAADITVAFFTDRADKPDIAHCADVFFFHSAKHLEQCS